MPKTRELTEIERAEIVGASKFGISVAEIARILKHPESAVWNG
jgi:hypothetical protein